MEQILNKWWIEISVSVAIFFAPVWSLVAYSTLLIFVDLITGIRAAKKRGETITSRAMSQTITKFLLYNLAIICGHGASYHFAPDLELGKVVLAAIALVELTSIDENFKDILGYSVFGRIIELFKRREKEPLE